MQCITCKTLVFRYWLVYGCFTRVALGALFDAVLVRLEVVLESFVVFCEVAWREAPWPVNGGILKTGQWEWLS